MHNTKLILIVEDEESICAMVRFAVENAGFSVIEAHDVPQARRLLGNQLPDLILLDWMLPAKSGVEFTFELKKDRLLRNIPIIILTAKAEEENKVKGLEAGADDYIIKPFSPKELIARIRAVLRRGPMETPGREIKIKELIIDTESQRVTIADVPVPLGPLEYRLLIFFVTHPDRVYSRDELLSHVWGAGVYVDERTVDVHIRRLRKRMTLKNYDKLIQTIRGSGYRFSIAE